MKIANALCLLLVVLVVEAGLGAVDPQDMPRVKKQVQPLYPALLKKAGIEGSVEMKVVVNEQGRVEKATLVKASNPDFVGSVTEAVKQWEFIPAEKDGRPISAEVIIPFTFKLGPDSYKSKYDELDKLQERVRRFLQGEGAGDLSSLVDSGAYAIIGTRYEFLPALLVDNAKRALLVEGPDEKVEFSHMTVDDSEDSAFLVVKSRPGKWKTERFHTIVFMKAAAGGWRIRAWQMSG